MPVSQAPVSIMVDFDKDSKILLQNLAATIGSLRNFQRFWNQPNGIVDLIKRDIRINIMQGIDPDLKTWPLLSPSYARIVDRPRMMLTSGEKSIEGGHVVRTAGDALRAYVDFPKLDKDVNFLVYRPNPDYDWQHYEYLRAGWISAGGGGARAPSEWFGIHPWTIQEIDTILGEYVQRTIDAGVRHRAAPHMPFGAASVPTGQIWSGF